MIGYIDRLARDGEGTYEIHDYKTSASWPWRRDLDDDRQLSLYEMGIRRLHPDAVDVKHVWHYLTLGRTFYRVRRGEDLERTARQTRRTIDRIVADSEFPARTKILCHWCDYADICPEGKAFTRSRRAPGLAT